MKKITSFLALLLSVILLTPSFSVFAASSPTNFSYLLENGSKPISTLLLEPNNTVDIKPSGISDLSTYRYQWQTSNPQVATVDQNGVITTYEEGTATIQLLVGDSTKYRSNKISIIVDKTPEVVTLGLPTNTAMKTYELPLNKTVDFAFYGVIGWNTDIYTIRWSSSNSSVATVDAKGEVTPKSLGSTTIRLSVKNKLTGKEVPTQPITVTVIKDEKITPVPTNTPKPTNTPTPKPTVTVEPTPTPIPVTFKAKIVSENSFVIEFNQSVTKTKKDFSVQANKTDWEIASVKWNPEKTTATITTKEYLWDGTSYLLSIDGVKNTANLKAKFEVPDRMELYWSSLGTEGKAYVRNEDDVSGYPIDVQLGVRLYAKDIDVTYTYLMQGFVDYDLITESKDYYTFLGDSLVFYEAGKSVSLKATYTYWNTNGKEVELTSKTEKITSTKAPAYKVQSVEEWTLLTIGKETKIDWDSPIQKIIAGTEQQYQIVCLVKDNYGNLYSTHENGVYDEYKNISDSDYPFACYGYDLYFTAKDSESYSVDSQGTFSAIEKVNKTFITVTASNGEKENALGSIPIKVLAPSKLTDIVVSDKEPSVSTDALSGQHEAVCQTSITFLPYDQYDMQYTGDCTFELSCNDTDVNNTLGGSTGPVYIDGSTIHINGQELRAITSKKSLQFTLKEPELKISERFTINLQDPSYDKEDEILVTGWSLGESKTYDITLTATDEAVIEKTIPINVYDISRANVAVGIRTDRVFLSTNSNQTYSTTNCSEGDIYLTILGPNGKTLSNVSGLSESLGFRQNKETGLLEVVAAKGTSKNPTFVNTLPSGTYTIHATYISQNDGKRVRTAKKTLDFQITQDIPKVVFAGVYSSSTDMEITDADSVKTLISEVFRFTINDIETKITPEMIYQVNYSKNKNNVRINSMILNIPYNGISEETTGYAITLNNLNKTITFQK